MLASILHIYALFYMNITLCSTSASNTTRCQNGAFQNVSDTTSAEVNLSSITAFNMDKTTNYTAWRTQRRVMTGHWEANN